MAERSFRPLFMYWGRRGISWLVYDLIRQALRVPGLSPLVSISRANELFSEFDAALGNDLVAIDTFRTNSGALTQAWRIPLLQHRLARTLSRQGITHVIDMMPHIWLPFFLPSIKQAGIRYIPLAHDAEVHLGDYRTRVAKKLIDRALSAADHVIALSQAVADKLLVTGTIRSDRMSVLFHPDLTFATPSSRSCRSPHDPPRVLFLGRIMPYKGLSLFIDTLEELRRNGFAVSCGVFGEGALDEYAARLSALGAEVVNRWLTEREIANILSRYDVLIASHIEASQSGVVAAALGAGLPVITTPVGGLKEQVQDGITGIIAEAVNVEALGMAIRRVFLTPGLHEYFCDNITAGAKGRSTAHFLQELLAVARSIPSRSDT